METGEPTGRSYVFGRWLLKVFRGLTIFLFVPLVLMGAVVQASPRLFCDSEDTECLGAEVAILDVTTTYLFAIGLLLFGLCYRQYRVVRIIASVFMLVPIVSVLSDVFVREIDLGWVLFALITWSIPFIYLMLLSLPSQWLPRCLH